MQRHRHDQIGLGDQLMACAQHHRAHGPRQLQPVAIFQPVDQLARHLAIAGDGPARAKTGGSAMAAGEMSLPPRSTAKGVPSRSQSGQ